MHIHTARPRDHSQHKTAPYPVIVYNETNATARAAHARRARDARAHGPTHSPAGRAAVYVVRATYGAAGKRPRRRYPAGRHRRAQQLASKTGSFLWHTSRELRGSSPAGRISPSSLSVANAIILVSLRRPSQLSQLARCCLLL